MRRNLTFFVSLCLCGLVFSSQRLHAENWPQWRGPEHNGVSRETGLPITWSETSGVVWKCPLEPWGTSTPDSPTPVVWNGLLFLVNDSGIAQCLDAKTGRVHWEQRLKGDYRASPLAAEGRIYFLNMKGLATVVAASPRFEKLAENQLDDATIASPIVSDGRVFIRGHKALYCLGK